MKRILAAAILAATCSTPALADDALKAAVNGSQRSPENMKRDTYRHPYETLTFFGIRPDMTVVELSPGGGWYTEILAPYLRERGKLIVAGATPESKAANVARAGERFKQKLDANPGVFGKVQMGAFEPGNGVFNYAPKGGADMVLTFRNVHNWKDEGDARLKAVLKSAYDALKPGGVFGVVEHRLPAAKTQDATASSGYVHEAYVIRLAEAAGFKLAAKSDVNANPKDTADHQGGVWALPPTYGNKDVDREKYAAIGESDRMTLKFVKP
ncbi:class I SAM-dependent methyltransferase [Pseudoduganella lutea]|uniref:Methyltransferase domain-containing protein n=1 Tax=Pseudoduganella lutea TaxID=321985 RepID=A0A4P6KYS2_9BURK|nr:class I SAM-dependent methyltransferase [Pseudoduganella lutea]QBE63458.1 methyltransferase domain-containing protein [Pseudoduganella lutea]